ncbi:MAG TPA: glutamyl-tRNA reductase [Gemmatimonadales bacterium]|nr:glutamyl-tRNA reductase [Gemmatimonadales bacterium]
MLRDLPFHVVGVSHHTAGIELRERFAFTPAEVAAWLQGQAAAGSTALLLSTCNRCEVYWTGDLDLEAWFRDFSLARGAPLGDAMLRLDGEDAVRHLFNVTAGLDSQVLGETEVLGQVRRAYDAARAAGTTDRLVDSILSAALVAGRRVRRETMLGRHPASVSSAAVDVAESAVGSLATARALVLGAGDVAEGVLRALHGRTAGTALVNRRADRAAALAQAWGGATGSWDDLDALLAAADLVFVATSAAQPLITGSRLAEAVRARGRGLAVFDLAVPRNVEPSARELADVQLFDLDDLQRLRCPAEGFSSPGIHHARHVLDQEIHRLNSALRARAAAPRLADLHRVAARLAEEEAEVALAQLGDLDERERRVVREMAERLVRRVLYPVSRTVREGGEAIPPSTVPSRPARAG